MGQKDDFEKLNRFKERVDEVKASSNRFQGELDGLLKSLKEKHEITSLKQTERKLKQVRKQRETLEEEFDGLLLTIENLIKESPEDE